MKDDLTPEDRTSSSNSPSWSLFASRSPCSCLSTHVKQWEGHVGSESVNVGP